MTIYSYNAQCYKGYEIPGGEGVENEYEMTLDGTRGRLTTSAKAVKLPSKRGHKS